MNWFLLNMFFYNGLIWSSKDSTIFCLKAIPSFKLPWDVTPLYVNFQFFLILNSPQFRDLLPFKYSCAHWQCFTITLEQNAIVYIKFPEKLLSLRNRWNIILNRLSEITSFYVYFFLKMIWILTILLQFYTFFYKYVSFFYNLFFCNSTDSKLEMNNFLKSNYFSRMWFEIGRISLCND